MNSDVTAATPEPSAAASVDPTRVEELRSRIADLMPQVRADLEGLVRIPSVSLSSFDSAHVEASAAEVARLLEAEGLDVEIVREEGGLPAVIGHRAAPEGAPTVLLYAHHDVQPPGKDEDWESPAFEPTQRGDRLYARGVADDKAGVMAHLAALRAHDGQPPVGVTVFVEGEEEVASASLPALLARYEDRLRCDAIVLADSSNWAIGTPALTVSLRGNVRMVVTVRTLQHGVHSGVYGGVAPDALTSMCRLLATLHDEDGTVAVEGLESTTAADLDYPEANFRSDAGMVEGVGLQGRGSIVERLWSQPAITVIGLDAPSVDTCANLLQAVTRAKISCRIIPQQDWKTAFEAVKTHLQKHAPYGAVVEVELDDFGNGFLAPTSGPYVESARAAFQDAWGVEPVDMGMGASIPFVAEFAERFPDAAILVTGVEDPDGRAHGANESLHLGEFERVCVAEAVLLERLGTLRAR